jgi:hypothetical protein
MWHAETGAALPLLCLSMWGFTVTTRVGSKLILSLGADMWFIKIPRTSGGKMRQTLNVMLCMFQPWV